MKSTNMKTADVNVSGEIDFKPEFTRPGSVKIGSVKTGLCEFAPDFKNMLVKNQMLNWKQCARKKSDLKVEQNESVEDEKKPIRVFAHGR